MATGSISSSFDIVLRGDCTGVTFYAPRSFTLTGITAQNSAALPGTLNITQVTTTNGVAAAAVQMTAIDVGTQGAAAYFTNGAAPGNSQQLAVMTNAQADIPEQTAPEPGVSTVGVYTQLTVTDSAFQLQQITLHCQALGAQAITVT